MTTEQKARAYDEALKRANKVNKGNADDREPGITICEYIFPELKESEDEKMRKSIIYALQNGGFYSSDKTDEAIAWLEKQGIQTTDKVEPKFKPGDTMRTWREAANGYTDGMPVIVSIDNEYYHCTNELIAIKDQDDYEFPPINVKQKSSDKVEPKFHEGDWIIRNNKYTGVPVQVIGFKGYYECDLNGKMITLTLNDVHNNFRLWAIADAKDGTRRKRISE